MAKLIRLLKSMSIKTSKSDPAHPENDRCLLLELPRELRDMIYNFALTENGGLIKYENFDPNSGDATGRFYTAEDEAKRNAISSNLSADNCARRRRVLDYD